MVLPSRERGSIPLLRVLLLRFVPPRYRRSAPRAQQRIHSQHRTISTVPLRLSRSHLPGPLRLAAPSDGGHLPAERSGIKGRGVAESSTLEL